MNDTKVCEICGDEFKLKKTTKGRRRSCGSTCRSKLHRRVKLKPLPVGVITDVNPYWIVREGSALVGRL